MGRQWLWPGIILGLAGAVAAQPAGGDVFREYRWFHEEGDAGQAIRVGGRKGEVHPDRGSAHGYINAPMTWPHDLDLDHAIKAEVVAEKILCHDGTTGLAIQINDSEWFYFPEADAIPTPQALYQHHTYPVLRVPVSVFKAGIGNRFRLRVDAEHPWDWPQNLINGLHVRVYYDAQAKPHPSGALTSPTSGDLLADTVRLTTEARSPNGPVDRVDYIGLYGDVNLEGDGVYRRWHYLYLHGRLMHHIGSSTHTPFAVEWDTAWIPDQREPLCLAAWITDRTGLTYQTEAVTGLSLGRRTFSVELCKPYDIPQKWVTRSGEKIEHFDVRGALDRARAMQLVWSSWSPGYMRGISINGVPVFDREGPCYQTYHHRVTLKALDALRAGRNELTTGKTPLIDGQMVHGMEVNWPGIMVLIRYDL